MSRTLAGQWRLASDAHPAKGVGRETGTGTFVPRDTPGGEKAKVPGALRGRDDGDVGMALVGAITGEGNGGGGKYPHIADHDPQAAVVGKDDAGIENGSAIPRASEDAEPGARGERITHIRSVGRVCVRG